MKTSFRKTWLPKLLLGAVLAILLWGLLLAEQIVAFSSQPDPAPADAAVVLGASVWGDRPSPVYQERINHFPQHVPESDQCSSYPRRARI